MNLPRQALLALCILPLCVPGGASAQQQDDKWGKPVDLKLLIPPVPPVVPLPRNYQLNPGTVGGSQTPYTSPLQNSSSAQPAPGIKLTIPTR